jgi:hypothetical protein
MVNVVGYDALKKVQLSLQLPVQFASVDVLKAYIAGNQWFKARNGT